MVSRPGSKSLLGDRVASADDDCFEIRPRDLLNLSLAFPSTGS